MMSTDNRVTYSCSHSIHFHIQCSLLWPALLSLLSFYQHSSIPRLSLSGFFTVHTALLHCADCPLYTLVITQQVMCVPYSTIALASLFITCGSLHSLVILLRHLQASGITLAFTLPHVVLLHSVTSLQYKGPRLGGEQSPSCLPIHFLTFTILNP